jgi:hypothetical protein
VKRKVVLLVVVFVCLAVALVAAFPVTRYIFAAYVFPGSEISLRGYPVLEPPQGFTGTWIDYTYSGRRLAVLHFIDGDEQGEQVYLDDAEVPYYVVFIADGRFDHYTVKRTVPADATIPFFFPQRWLNPSLRARKADIDAKPSTSPGV